MSFWLVLAILFSLLTVVGIVATVLFKAKAGLAIAGTAFLAILFGVISSAHTVPTKNVGIVTQFNKHTGKNTGAGWHWTAPWQKIEDWDASRQTYDHLHQDRCVQVRIVGLQSACVEVQIEWQVKPEQAPEQWANYRKDFEHFTNRRVNPNLRDALSSAFVTHDPLSTVDIKNAVIKPVNMSSFKEPVLAEVDRRIGQDITILNVTWGFIHYNDATQKTIEQFQSKVLEARNLQQDLANAETRRLITEKNTQRNSTSWCLEIAEKAGKEPGFCLGGGNPTQVTGGR